MFAGGCQRERLAAALLGYRLALDQCRVREAGEELGDGWLETPARRASSVPETPSRAIARSARYWVTVSGGLGSKCGGSGS